MRDGIHMTIWCSNYDYKMGIRRQLERILKPAAERLLENFRMVSPVFIAKVRGEGTTFPIHQDWSVVDETKHRAFNVWIPLQDVDKGNGGLWVLPGSHKLPTVVRGPGFLFPNLYDVEAELRPRMTQIDVAAGECMIFYHRVVHGSPPNTTGDIRTAVSFSALPKGVPLHIYFQRGPGDPLQVYHPDDQFIYRFENVRDHTATTPPDMPPAEIRESYQPIEIELEMFN